MLLVLCNIFTCILFTGCIFLYFDHQYNFFMLYTLTFTIKITQFNYTCISTLTPPPPLHLSTVTFLLHFVNSNLHLSSYPSRLHNFEMPAHDLYLHALILCLHHHPRGLPSASTRDRSASLPHPRCMLWHSPVESCYLCRHMCWDCACLSMLFQYYIQFVCAIHM